MTSGVSGFYALDVGLGVASWACPVVVRRESVSMPSMSGWVLRGHWLPGWWRPLRFLCPRCRAGCCEVRHKVEAIVNASVSMPSMSGWVLRGSPTAIRDGQCETGFYALDVGLGVASAGAGCRFAVLYPVSMPSMSGWVLRGDASFRCL